MQDNKWQEKYEEIKENSEPINEADDAKQWKVQINKINSYYEDLLRELERLHKMSKQTGIKDKSDVSIARRELEFWNAKHFSTVGSKGKLT